MIRFVDIRGQGTGCSFAFWDSVRARFCDFNGEQAWCDVSDFSEAFMLDVKRYGSPYDRAGLERFLRLIPEGQFQQSTDDEDT